MKSAAPTTLRQAILFFADYENCRKAVEAIRWPKGKVTCPTCGGDNVTWLATQKRYKCYVKHPKAQFSLKVGTIFEDSPIGFEKWLPALWLVTNCKNGISSYELGKALGVTQKSAWFMLSRLRLALQADKGSKFSGRIEADETFIGGKTINMSHAKRQRVMGKSKGGQTGKIAVMGLLERHGKGRSIVRTEVLANTRKPLVEKAVRENVEPGSRLYTDAMHSYRDLSSEYIHKFIDHAESYAQGAVHTNGLENFWSLLKRALKGTYVSVEPFHLFRYLDEQAYRFNTRAMTDAQRFADALKGIVGKRLTYTTLTGSELPQRC
jgi:transposase-like protein